MGISRTTIRAFRVIGAALCVTLGQSPSTLASPAKHAALVHTAATAPAPKPDAAKAVKIALGDKTTSAPAPEHRTAPEPRLRRIKPGEVTVAIAKKARKIINANYTKPFGTEIPFEIAGEHYVGRIERHYHPPGGKLHPWGYHHGCSVFVVVR